MAAANHLPLDDMPAMREVADYYYDWLAHGTYDDYWKAIAPREKFDRITVPALIQGGWYDGFIRATLRCYEGMRERGASELARTQQHLVVGPWLHQPLPEPSAGIGYFGPSASGAAIDWHGMQLAWFDRWLRDEDNGVDRDPPVYIFVMGRNEWRAEEGWPPPDAETMTLFLRSGGGANSRFGDGALSEDPPGESEPADHFLYNPLNPVPTTGGGASGRDSDGVRGGSARSARGGRARGTFWSIRRRRWSGIRRLRATLRWICGRRRRRRIRTGRRSWLTFIPTAKPSMFATGF